MSYTVTAYTVDLERIGRQLGSLDAVSCGAVVDSAADALEQKARACRHLFPAEALDRALVELLTARPDELTAEHGYALEAWVNSVGHAHPNDGWWSMRMAWFEQVDAALVGAGHAPLLGHPLIDGLPFPFPLQDEWPLISHLPRARCAALAASLDAALAAPMWRGADETEAARMLQRWAADAALWDLDLIAFYA